jgi:peptide/nickel transport system substrate-binding protein
MKKFQVVVLLGALLVGIVGFTAVSRDFMIVGMGQEPDTWAPWALMLASAVIEEAMTAGLFYQDDAWVLHPYLAVARPSIPDGTWQIFEEGEGPVVINEWTGKEAEVRMIVDWEFREGIVYHDGVPWSVENVIFGRRVWMQAGFPAPTYLARKVSRIEITGERSIRVYWNRLYPFADQLWGSDILPKHILYDAFRQWVETGVITPFKAHPFWLTEFVSTGPFRLVDWIPGSHITLERFDNFFMAQVDEHYRPRLRRLIFKFIEDVETLAIMVRTGEVHVTVPPNFPFDTALILYRDIKAGVVPADVVVEFREGVIWEHVSLSTADRPDLPLQHMRDAFRDVRVRRAILHAIDRETLTEELFEGRQVVSHGPLPLLHPLMSPEAEAAQRVYEYNPELAKQLLAEAGWTLGPDGILVNADGDRFIINIRTTAGNLTREMIQVILADHWRAVGIETVIENLPPAVLFGMAHFRAPGAWPTAVMFAWNLGLTHLPKSLWHSVNVMPAGWNVAQWANPEADAVIEAIMTEMDPVGRQRLMVEFMRLWTEDVAAIPLYFRAENPTRLANVVGFRPPGVGLSTWNTWEWAWATR